MATMAEANQRNVLIALIESRQGIDNAEAILAVPGLDVGWLGHFDLTSDLGIPAQFDHPEFIAAVDRLAEASQSDRQALGLARRPARASEPDGEQGISHPGLRQRRRRAAQRLHARSGRLRAAFESQRDRRG